jgi:hypothetical protein
MDLIDHITKGRKQGSIVYAPRIRPTAPTSVLSGVEAGKLIIMGAHLTDGVIVST